MPTSNIVTRISLFKKQAHLRSLNEDEFRDQVVRPLFLRKGLKDGRDYCGPTEYGKDCLFAYVDPLGDTNIYTVQTKAGDLNMSSKASQNILNALTQVKMMIDVDIPLLTEKAIRKPNKVFLCVSGKINDAARNYIVTKANSPHIEFRDSDDLIPEIDDHLPEFWLGIEANKSPYLAALHDSLISETLVEKGNRDIFSLSVDGESIIQLNANRLKLEKRKVRGEYFVEEVTEPKFQEIPIEDFLTISDLKILLTADAGDGKTTCLRRLALKQCEWSLDNIEKANVPILVRALELVKNGDELLEYLFAQTTAISKTSEPAFDHEDLNQGRVTLLIDALDEIPDQDERQHLINLLAEFMSKYSKCRIILASRNFIWIDDLIGIQLFERFRISPIHWRQTIRLIKKFQKGQGLQEEKAAEVLRQLQEVHGMDLNPFMVTIFLASSDSQRSDIPANITELFKKFTEQMLGRWDESKGFAQQYQGPLKDFLLRHVALRMHKQRVTAISLRGLKEILAEELEKRGQEADTDQLIEEVVFRSGLFRILGDEVEFRHLLVQEFFAGRGLNANEINDLVGDSWWQRCIIFYFGENPSGQSIFEKATESLKKRVEADLMQAALTLGLALQACYLITLDEKAILYSDVIEAMGRATHNLFMESASVSKLPITEFIGEYIFGRDSASCDVLSKKSSDVEGLIETMLVHDEGEYTEFWYIVGLIECGLLNKAFERIKAFDPEDRRTLLSLHLGLMLYENTRVTSKEKKQLAREIISFLAPKVQPLIGLVLKEFKSQILELRKGKIEALTDPRDDVQTIDVVSI